MWLSPTQTNSDQFQLSQPIGLIILNEQTQQFPQASGLQIQSLLQDQSPQLELLILLQDPQTFELINQTDCNLQECNQPVQL